MALHTQRCYARFLSLRLPCLRVFALLTTRCVLRGVPLACVDQGSHCAFYYRVCFRFVSESCDQLPFYNLFLFQNLFAVPFLFQTGTIPCFTLAHLIIRCTIAWLVVGGRVCPLRIVVFVHIIPHGRFSTYSPHSATIGILAHRPGVRIDQTIEYPNRSGSNNRRGRG